MITLRPMTEAELQEFLEPAIAEYAQGHIDDGQWTKEEALEKSRAEFHGLLPEGVASPNQYLFTLVNEEQQNVGVLWFAAREQQGQRAAWVYDVRIYEAFRRHGYGSLAFRAMEQKVRELGLAKIGLHVFGNNYAAQEMYKKLGYETTNVLMAKTLDA